ncbi:MAG: Hsp20/alpha crystallin family protein [Saprospiraceae bacterium]|nr:Hsp20/alpha crystallin family protein [Saprospiraceae bacterium]MDW8229874.1 Hsp20/alpha crystallin family protein [Saprospiraceae bacterium]
MALIKWNPEVSLFPSMSTWLADFFDDWNEGNVPAIKGVSIPAVNVSETPEAYAVEVAAPGFSKDNFRLEVKDGYLVISGEMKEEKKEEEKGKYTRREFRYGSFSRAFALPNNVDEHNIRAQYNDGILRINLPKKESEAKAPTKSITIE